MQNLRWLGVRVRAPRFVVTSLARTSSVSANISNALQEEYFKQCCDIRSGSEFPYANDDPDWHQNDPDPYADPTPSFTHIFQNPNFLILFLVTALTVYNVLSFSAVSRTL
jgi:hypothetical protein